MVNVLCVGITLMILLGVALFFHVLIKVTPEEGWTSTIMAILTLVYITGLFGNTMPALAIMCVLGIIGIALGIVNQIKHKECRITTFVTPAIVMIVCMAGFAVVAFHGFRVCNWDELFQWGKAANYMVEQDILPNGDAFSGSSLLLSNTTFFHYIMAKLYYVISGEIAESDYYVSNLLLWFSAVILPLSGCGWKEWKRVWGFGLFHFMLTAIIFVQPYYNIYTDQATAYWAGALTAWLVLKKYYKNNIYLVPLILLNVGMMKSMVGPLFACIVMLAILVLYITNCKEENKPIIPKEWKRVVFSKKGIFGIATVSAPIIFVVIWSLVIGKNGLFRGHFYSIDKQRFVLTVKAMIQKLFVAVNMKNDGLELSYLLFFIIVAGLLYFIYPIIIKKPLLPAYTNLICVYLAGFAGYFAVMLFAYLFVFGYTDSVRAMSLERYFSDYMMLGVIPVTIPLFVRIEPDKNLKFINMLKKGTITTFFICIVAGSSSYILPNLFHLYAVDTDLYKERERFIKYTNKVKDITEGEGKIYFINQSSTGLYTLVADYEMGEQLSREGMCFNFRKNTKETIIGLTDHKISDWPDILVDEEYKYVWIYTKNDYLEEEMKKLFGISKVKAGDFFKISQTNNKVVLEYMGNVQK